VNTTDVAAASGVKVKVTEDLALASVCPNPQGEKAAPDEGPLSVPPLGFSARKPLKAKGPLSVTVMGTPGCSGALACARASETGGARCQPRIRWGHASRALAASAQPHSAECARKVVTP
jgi:hypothetical protein